MKAFRDDWGFEAVSLGKPTKAKPGSVEKVAELRERVERGFCLWHPEDQLELNTTIKSDLKTYRTIGDDLFGVMIGEDQFGHPHRFAIWSKIKKERERYRVLYVPETTSYVDSFDRDVELSAIYRHADLCGASHVLVCSVFSKRCRSYREFHGSHSEPMTYLTTCLMRKLACLVDRVVVCCGDNGTNVIATEVIWALSRATKDGLVYAVEKGCKMPPPVTRFTAPIVYEYPVEGQPAIEDEDYGWEEDVAGIYL